MTPHREAFPSAAQRRLIAALRHEDLTTGAIRERLDWNGAVTYGHMLRLEALGCVLRHRVGGRIKWRYVGLPTQPQPANAPVVPKSGQRVGPQYRPEFRPLTHLDLFQHARLAMLTRY